MPSDLPDRSRSRDVSFRLVVSSRHDRSLRRFPSRRHSVDFHRSCETGRADPFDALCATIRPRCPASVPLRRDVRIVSVIASQWPTHAAPMASFALLAGGPTGRGGFVRRAARPITSKTGCRFSRWVRSARFVRGQDDRRFGGWVALKIRRNWLSPCTHETGFIGMGVAPRHEARFANSKPPGRTPPGDRLEITDPPQPPRMHADIISGTARIVRSFSSLISCTPRRLDDLIAASSTRSRTRRARNAISRRSPRF